MRLASLALVPLALGLVAAHGPDLLADSCARKRAPQHQRRQNLVSTGEGTAPTGGGAAAARYSCDASRCRLPDCHCADVKPPGNLDIKDVPQFITLTADDALQSFTVNAMASLMNGRKNPNGCPVRATYFTQLAYTNYSMVTDWYVAGNDVADHTVTHQAQPSTGEISGNLIALNELAGIPFRSLGGFRAPYLNYTRETLESLNRMQFVYDSSSSSSVPTTDPNSDAFWPYTLDNGMANDCSGDIPNICSGEPKLPGFWEIPMYSVYESPTLPHLMDPWLDASPDQVLGWMQNTFMDHYNNNKQPFGMYSHPIHIATGYPGLGDPTQTVNMLNRFLDFAHSNSSMSNVWMVTNTQLLAWMRNPVPASQLNTLDEFKCQTPDVQEAVICNGMPDKQNTVLQHCISDTPGDSLNNSPFYTCYGCPTTQPTVEQPSPPQNNATGSIRTRINASCDTPFWDPIAGRCLNSGFTDETRSIGANGEGITSTGTTGTATDNSGAKTDPFTTFGSSGGAADLLVPRLALVGASVAAALAVFA